MTSARRQSSAAPQGGFWTPPGAPNFPAFGRVAGAQAHYPLRNPQKPYDGRYR